MLAASNRVSYFEQKRLIVLDEEEQGRWENETASASRLKLEDKGKDESAEPGSQETCQKLAGLHAYIPMGFLSLAYANAFYLSSASLNLFR